MYQPILIVSRNGITHDSNAPVMLSGQAIRGGLIRFRDCETASLKSLLKWR